MLFYGIGVLLLNCVFTHEVHNLPWFLPDMCCPGTTASTNKAILPDALLSGASFGFRTLGGKLLVSPLRMQLLASALWVQLLVSHLWVQLLVSALWEQLLVSPLWVQFLVSALWEQLLVLGRIETRLAHPSPQAV